MSKPLRWLKWLFQFIFGVKKTMINLPNALDNFMKGKDLAGLKPFAFLYRNKWDSVNNAYTLDSTPIDISGLIVKPNTLSMTLDVNEIAQYNANNVTLTLSDTENRFVEGTPKSYFPEGYQLYGSRVVLYYGLNSPFNPATSQVNYTVVGTPVISDGIVSGFSANDYITLPMLDSTQKFKFHFDFNSSGTGYVYCLGATWNEALVFEIQANNAFRIWLKGQSVANVSNSLNKHITGTITYDGNDYTIKFAVNGQNYQNKAQNIGALSANAVPVYIGKLYSSSYFGGSINLKETYIKVNGQNWFNGAAFFYTANSTPLFTGVIKDLPTYKPEKYQVDLKLVSPLELLKDIEAKEFSNKVTGETLTYVETDSDGHKIYQTAGTGVGGFNAVYADGNKLFEGVDYEVDQTNALGLPAKVTIINSDHYSATITADYYTWKTGLTVEQIVAGLVSLAGYDSGTEDIRAVAWNTEVRNPPISSPVLAALGYYESALNEYTFLYEGAQNSWDYCVINGGYNRRNILTRNFDYSFTFHIHTYSRQEGSGAISLGDEYDGTAIIYNLGGLNKNIGECGVKNGISVRFSKLASSSSIYRTFVLIYQITNGNATLLYSLQTASGGGGQVVNLTIIRRDNTISILRDNAEIYSFTETRDFPYQRYFYSGAEILSVENQKWNIYNSNLYLLASNLTKPCIITEKLDMTVVGNYWGAISADLESVGSTQYFLQAAFSADGNTWSALQNINLNTSLGNTERYMYYVLGIDNAPTDYFDIKNPTTYYYALNLLVNLVNLSGLTVLEALQDFALISGYEFGVDRQGVFFFKPRVASTNPTYVLGHDEVVKIDTVKKNLSDFFTKLTLTFAQVPLEFYANTGGRPTLVDKYGIINKEIDKPDIVNYDNPELAQAIGPQLLEVYSSMPNIIQAVGKLNLALELGDIVSLRRNFNLVEPNSATDYAKYITQQTYYRACKITGMNYNFSKKQITYTLRDVTNENNVPPASAYGFPYDFPVELGKLKE